MILKVFDTKKIMNIKPNQMFKKASNRKTKGFEKNLESKLTKKRSIRNYINQLIKKTEL